MWAVTVWPLSSSTRNMVLGRVSMMVPSISMLSSLAIHTVSGFKGARIMDLALALIKLLGNIAGPDPTDQKLQGLIVGFVIHLFAGLNPVTQIDIREL